MGSGCWFGVLVTEGAPSLRIPANWTVGSRRSKKESCSTWRGLPVDTNLVEFQ